MQRLILIWSEKLLGLCTHMVRDPSSGGTSLESHLGPSLGTAHLKDP